MNTPTDTHPLPQKTTTPDVDPTNQRCARSWNPPQIIDISTLDLTEKDYSTGEYITVGVGAS